MANPLALARWTSVTAEAAPFVKRYSEFLQDKEAKAKASGGSFLAKGAGAKEYAEFRGMVQTEKVKFDNADKAAAAKANDPLTAATLNVKEVERALIRRDEVSLLIIAAVQGLQTKITIKQ